MKKITLICAGGFSTSMLVSNMEKAAKDKEIKVEIRATAESKFREYENDTDILLLGPQVGYLFERLKQRYSKYNMEISVIDSVDYGMMDGEKILNKALKIQ
ncbi:PTS sugar transporter subunit IIB [Clostridium sp. C2-6-12]|uniref:PTS sugar transporter subunit IIB n=1 Tax=Clostridium sp. C2-6-12 TaxID=2698832 RepID=UPI00136827F8|nr:PTS sugar transporter subunit IIB [Clostridium sp. C2-6-12]